MVDREELSASKWWMVYV